MVSNKKKPSVFEYIDLGLYLKAYVQFRKSLPTEFSYDVWAKELGFKSRSYLRMIAMGKKKATDSFVQSFADTAFIDPVEKDYFRTLVFYSQCKTHKEKQLYGKMLVQAIHRSTGQKDIENHFDFLSDNLLPRLLVLLSFTDIATSPDNLGLILNCQKEEAAVALQKLEQLGLADYQIQGGEKTWKSKNTKFKVPSELGSIALKTFHENSARAAIQAFSLPIELRRYRSLIIPLNDHEMMQLFDMLENFANEVIMRYDSDSYAGRKLFQMNYNVFPVTNKVSEKTME